MEYMKWDEKFNVNVKIVDEQHQHLVSLLNDIHAAVVNGSEQGVLAKILDDLVDYTVYHFTTEEDIFKKYNYPEAEIHKKQHDGLTKQVVDLQTNFKDGSATISFELLDFLQDWLGNHIIGSDMKFKEFFHEKGIF